MSYPPRTRVSRSGQMPATRRRNWNTALLLLFALLLSACTTNVEPTQNEPATTIAAYEAEDAEVTQSFLVVRDEPGTSGGRILVQPDTIMSAGTVAEDAYLTFTVETAGEHFLWARVKGRSATEDAVYAGFDGRLERIYPDVHGTYVWLPVTFESLEPGEHVISLGHGEPEMSVDALVVTSRADLTAADLEAWLLTDTLPAMPDPTDPSDGGAPADPAEPQPEPQPAPQPAPSSPRSSTDLRGNPSFKVSSLSPEAQIWYRRLWEAIDNPISTYEPYQWASSDDLYTYARQLHTYVQTLLTAFRLTGDLNLLDEIDKLTETMRGKLADSWRGTLDGTQQRDGYLNWVWRQDHATSYTGKDTNELDEIKTHAMIASVAYALDVNRDLKSPGGRNYAAHADFWEGYLVNHFEAKWRKRENEPTGFPFMLRPHTHTYYSWTKWHYYMGKLTGKSGYSKEANRMADMLWNHEIIATSSPSGTAYVWNRSVLSEGGSADYLHPTTYARYVYSDVVELYLEGFHRWADPEAMTRFTRTIAEFVIDPAGAQDGTDWFSSDIGGGRSRSGIRSDPEWSRMTIYRYESSPYGLMMAWDRSDKIEAISMKVLGKLGGADKARTIYLPAAFLIDRVLAVN